MTQTSCEARSAALRFAPSGANLTAAYKSINSPAITATSHSMKGEPRAQQTGAAPAASSSAAHPRHSFPPPTSRGSCQRRRPARTPRRRSRQHPSADHPSYLGPHRGGGPRQLWSLLLLLPAAPPPALRVQISLRIRSGGRLPSAAPALQPTRPPSPRTPAASSPGASGCAPQWCSRSRTASP